MNKICIFLCMSAISFLPAFEATPAFAAVAGGGPASAPWIVQLIALLAWPVAAVFVALLFRKPLSALVSAIGGRVTKLSLFKVEIELAPSDAATTPLLDELKRAAIGTQAGDSSAMTLRQLQEGTPAQFALIDLGAGEEWLTSRLYITAIMLERMRDVRAFVFLDSASGVKRRFVAIASTGQVRWALARRYSWLEGAWLQASHLLVQRIAKPPPGPDGQPRPIITSDGGALDVEFARAVVRDFIVRLQSQPGPQGDPEWVLFGNGNAERASWITRDTLESLLPAPCFDALAPIMRDAPRGRRTRAILRRSGDFIALAEDDGRFAGQIVDRRALLEQLAASSAEETEGK